MSVCFLITTYNRQESCQRLVDSLQGKGEIIVLNDGCDYEINGCTQHKQVTHHGKEFYWKTVSNLFKLRVVSKYYFMLPDDFLPVEGMVDRAIGLWGGINDPKKICLNLIADRIGVSCWTNMKPIDCGDVWRTGWVDMCFLCEDAFFQATDVREIQNRSWGSKMSSGVGAQISRRLHRFKYHLYQVKEGLMLPQEAHCTSQMHDSKNHGALRHYSKGRFVTDTRL